MVFTNPIARLTIRWFIHYLLQTVKTLGNHIQLLSWILSNCKCLAKIFLNFSSIFWLFQLNIRRMTQAFHKIIFEIYKLVLYSSQWNNHFVEYISLESIIKYLSFLPLHCMLYCRCHVKYFILTLQRVEFELLQILKYLPL